MVTPYDMVRSELARDGGRPFITFYDDATDERVELSVSTFDNWVAKTAGFLRDGLSAEPGDRVALLLPAHWQALVWACACWAVGATAVLGTDADRSADVVVAGPDALDVLNTATGAMEIVALSLRPLGGRFTEPLAPGVLDYAVEVPTYPDRLMPYVPPHDDDPALEVDGTASSYDSLVGQALERSAELGVAAGARLLVPSDEPAIAVRDALLVPLVVGGSAVLVRNEDPSTRDARVAAERVTAIAP